MTKNEHNSLVDALSFCSLKDLPDKDNGVDFWLQALAHVAKRDGSKGFVLLKKDENLDIRVVKDFVNVSAIYKVLDIYPFDFIKDRFIPKFKGKNKEDRIKYLVGVKGIGDYTSLTLKELDFEVLKSAVALQRKEEKGKKEKRNEQEQ